MKRRVLFAFVILNIIISVVVTFTVATLIAQSRPEPTPIALSPVVIVATPTGPTQTPIVITVIATRDPNAVPYVPELDATDIANTAAAVYAGEGGTGETGSETGADDETPTRRPTLSDIDRTVTAAAANQIETHIVQSGEYFGLIAQQYGVTVADLLCQNNLTESDYIYPGDVLIIPGPEGCDYEPPTETPSFTDTPTRTPTLEKTATPTLVPTITLRPTAESAQVKVTDVLSPGDVTDEEVILTNEGGLVDLQGWTLSDREGETVFTFSDYRLFPGGSVSVRTRKGENTPIVRYWNQDTAMWGGEDATVILTDAEGNVQSIYVVGAPGGVPPTPPPTATGGAGEGEGEGEGEDEDEDAVPTATSRPLG
ncbi:MAG: lamin tail domain-containing protein [Anaerolineae bacterium]|nr:lamin tail domain-containing protein [Anaerolineae bacterium]